MYIASQDNHVTTDSHTPFIADWHLTYAHPFPATGFDIFPDGALSGHPGGLPAAEGLFLRAH